MSYLYNKPPLQPNRTSLRQNSTDAENALWYHLRNKQFLGLKFRRQYSVDAYVLDFYCPSLRLAIELDGGQHAEADQMDYDQIRTEFLASQDIHVIRFWNNDALQNMDGLLERLQIEIDRLRVPPPNPRLL